jgi:uncharacterized SAM-binding protein YcdF (DUF218 family)
MLLRWPFKILMKLVSLVVTAAVIYVIISGVQVVLGSKVPQGTKALTSASAIIVLGSSVEQNAPSADFVHRLEEALTCFHDHLAQTFIVTGTNLRQTNAGKAWLEQNGVPSSAINFVNGANTAAQLQAAAAKTGAGQNAIVVTDAMDALWVRGTAVHYRLHPQIAPALDSERPFYDQIGTVLSQAGAVAVGRIIGFERATWV